MARMGESLTVQNNYNEFSRIMAVWFDVIVLFFHLITASCNTQGWPPLGLSSDFHSENALCVCGVFT